MNAATFLTVNEKRAAVGYAPVDIAPPDATTPEAKAGYDPNQPRVPAGSSDGGQWTDGGGGGGSSSSGRVRVAQADTGTLNDAGEQERFIQLAQAEGRRYTVNLDEEEANGGHTLKLHIAKNDLEVRQLLEARTGRFATISAYAAVESAFDSKESANDYVNRLLQENAGDVDLVAEGVLEEKWLTKRFGYVTGREAFRQGSIDNVVVRKTYNAGAFIVHDARSPRGFRVITAYPFNDDTE